MWVLDRNQGSPKVKLRNATIPIKQKWELWDNLLFITESTANQIIMICSET